MQKRFSKLFIILSFLISYSCSNNSILKIENTLGSNLNNTCTISGRILDKETKEPLIGANITLDLTKYGAATDTNGYFKMENVQPGSYRVNVSYVGYKNYTRSNVKFEGNTIYKLNVELVSYPSIVD